MHRFVLFPAAAARQPVPLNHPLPLVALYRSASAEHVTGSLFTLPQLAWPVQHASGTVGGGGGEGGGGRGGTGLGGGSGGGGLGAMVQETPDQPLVQLHE